MNWEWVSNVVSFCWERINSPKNRQHIHAMHVVVMQIIPTAVVAHYSETWLLRQTQEQPLLVTTLDQNLRLLRMEYTMPTKAADFVEGGDGYDLETLFSKVNQGVTCTYDDLIFMPGMESDWSVCVWGWRFVIDFWGGSFWRDSPNWAHGLFGESILMGV